MPELNFNVAKLFASGERLPAIKHWLRETVWTQQRYGQMEPEQYLRSGEAAVCRLKELIATGALRVWDELHAESQRAPSVKAWLGLDGPLAPTGTKAAIVFDGLSLREMPLLMQLAEVSGLKVKSAEVIATCLPTETIHFVDERVLGTRVGPSQLRGRTELAQKNTAAFYLEQPNSRHNFPAAKNLLIWSTYPDRLFADDSARSEALFQTFHREYIPTIWQCTAQALPRGVPAIVTSDHGYIFLGTSLEASRSSGAPELLGQSRFKQFRDDEPLPTWNPDLQVLPKTRIAMLRGRLRTRPSGTSSRKLYQHGGFSLMEVLVPWIELEPK